MDIDKLIQYNYEENWILCFSSLMDIDKLIHIIINVNDGTGFSSLMDIYNLYIKTMVYFKDYINL